MKKFTLPFDQIRMDDLNSVGGKNASLGELIHNLDSMGILVQDGFAITTDAYSQFLTRNNLISSLRISLKKLDRVRLTNLSVVGAECRALIMGGALQEELEDAIMQEYIGLLSHGVGHSVAVRSSASAVGSSATNFTKLHDSFLNVSGIHQVLDAVKKCYASLFNDRAIRYRIENGFGDMQVRLSVGIQVMVRSDRASAGVILPTRLRNGNLNLIYIAGAWGLGNNVEQGANDTDEFYLFRPSREEKKSGIACYSLGAKKQMLVYGHNNSQNVEYVPTSISLRDRYILTEEEVKKLAQWSLSIERHYCRPMNIEWAKDGCTGQLLILQAQPDKEITPQREVA